MARSTSSSRRRPLVGREDELERMRDALDRADDGEGGLVLVSGEPGIGKTRLVEELALTAVDHGGLVAWGRVDDEDGAPPYWPWIQVLESLLRQEDSAVLRAALDLTAGPMAAILPGLPALVTQLAPSPLVDPAAARFRLHHAVVDFLAAIRAHRSLVLVLDDMHWADVSSLELTRFVAARLTDVPLMLVVTYRDVDAGGSASFDDVLASLARHPSLERIALAGLSAPDVSRFMVQTTGLRPASGVAASVHARTEGNPFFVGELARLLQSEGRFGSPIAADRDPTGEVVPVGVRDVIRRRLARLPEKTNDLLVIAAVLGREFDVGALGAVADLTTTEIVDGLEPALAAGLVSAVGRTAGRLRFAHALARDTIYGELSALRRAALHARVGEALEGRPEARSRQAELAWHFFHAAPVLGPDRGLGYALEAAAAAQRAVSYERAEDDLRRALSLIELLPPDADRRAKELDVLNRLIALMILTRGFAEPEVGRASARAKDLCEELGAFDALFKALNNLANFHHVRGDLSRAIELGGQLLSTGDARSDARWRTAGHLLLGMAQLQAGHLLPARDSLATVRALAPGLDLSAEVAESFFGLHPLPMALMYSARSEWTLGETAAACELADEGVRLATTLGHPHTLAFAWYFDTHLRVLLGDAAAVIERTRRGTAFCEAHGLTSYHGWFRLLETWATAHEDRAQTAATEMNDLVTVNQTGGPTINRPFFLSLQAEVEARRGNVVRALTLVEEALAAIDEDRLWESHLCRLRGELLAALGPSHHLPAARDSLRRAVAIADAQGGLAFRRRALAALAALDRPQGH